MTPHARQRLWLAGSILVLLSAAVAVAPSGERGASGGRTPKEPAPTQVGPLEPHTLDPGRLSDAMNDAAPVETAANILVEGIVFDRSGAPARSAAVVEIVPEGGASRRPSSGTVRAEGRFRIVLRQSAVLQTYLARARDAVSGDTSASVSFQARRGEPCCFLPLHLRETVVVRGRVLDGSGDPVSGARVRVAADGLRSVMAWNASEALDDEARARTDARGEFAVRVRRRGGRVSVASRSGAYGPPFRYECPERGAVDVGDLLEPESQLIHWTLRFIDETGTAGRGALVKLGAADAWNMLAHPAFDPGTYCIPADAAGVAKVTLHCREAPAVIAAGGAMYQTRVLALDCRYPGAREVTVRLERRPWVRIRLAGAAADDLLALGLKVEIGRGGSETGPPREYPVVDAVSGARVSLPRDRTLSPGDLLESELSEKQVVRETPYEYVVRPPEPGRYIVRLLLQEVVIQDQDLEIVTQGGARVVELPVPAGRRAALDCSELARWARAGKVRTWFSRYSAWAREPRVEEGPDGNLLEASREIEMPVALLGDDGTVGSATKWIWVPAGVDTVGFGFLEHSYGGHFVPSPSSEVEHRALTVESVPRLGVPVPATAVSRTAKVVVKVHRGGVPFRQAGIPIVFYRRGNSLPSSDTPHGYSSVFTDGRGRAVIRMFPGRYLIGIDGSTARWGPTPLEVQPTSGTIDVNLDLEFPR